MNTGAIKWAEADAEIDRINKALPKIAEQRRNAFRFGFLKAAKEMGLFKKQAFLPVPVITMGVGDILNIPRSMAKAITGAGRTAGSLAGTIDAPDETEEELTKMDLDRMLLEEQLQRLRADKRNTMLRKVLAKRHG